MEQLFLTKNIGHTDRWARLAMGTVLAVAPAAIRMSAGTTALLAALGGTQLHAAISGY